MNQDSLVSIGLMIVIVAAAWSLRGQLAEIRQELTLLRRDLGDKAAKSDITRAIDEHLQREH